MGVPRCGSMPPGFEGTAAPFGTADDPLVAGAEGCATRSWSNSAALPVPV